MRVEILDRNRTHEVVSCDMYCVCCAVCTNKMGPGLQDHMYSFKKKKVSGWDTVIQIKFYYNVKEEL